MLLEFRVENFRCIRDEQVFSMVASSNRFRLDSNATSTGIKAAPYTLNSTAIYGANAGGKTTLVQAIATMQQIVISSVDAIPRTRTRAGGVPVTPFLLDPKNAVAPVSFEVSFIQKGMRYQYGFSCTPEKIVSEYLDVYQTSQPQRWFERHLSGDDYTYRFSIHLRGQKKSWQNQTRPDALFLSTAVRLNSEMLRPVFTFFADDISVFTSISSFRNMLPNLERVYESESLKKELCAFLQAADISIDAIDIKKRNQPSPDRAYPEISLEQYEIFFKHSTPRGHASFPIAWESLGTQNLFYLYIQLFSGLKNGTTLIIDELDSSLHPLIVESIIKLFHSKNLNSHGAQLIFTTHDTSLLKGIDTTLLRRDQVWFIEKDDNQASRIYSMADYNATGDNYPEKSYFQGRYGGIPLISLNTEEEE